MDLLYFLPYFRNISRMQEFERKDFSKILKRNALEAHRWMKETESTVSRVYDRNIGAFPVTVELFGPYARIVDYADGGLDEDDVTVVRDLVSRFLYIESEKIIYVQRKKREGREQHEKADGSLVVNVLENGLSFECELMKYTDTGLFLDQVNTRKMIRDMSEGMRVLNLFSYTGSFSVYAAAGGAESVASVDLSNVYSAWARRNLAANGYLDEAKYSVVSGDAGGYLEKCIEDGSRFDIVIFDPPAFSNSHKAEDFDVEKDYLRYLLMISKVLVPGGCVLFSENLAGFTFHKEKLKPYWKIMEITDEMRPQGFSAKRSALRVWWMKKVADMNEIRATAGRKKRVMDEEKIERLSIDAEEGGREPGMEKREKREERRDERRPERRNGYRGSSDRPRYGRDERGFSRRDDRRQYSRDGGYGRRDRDERPRYRDDERPRYRDGYRSESRYDDRPRYRDDERPRYRDDRPRYRSYDERPRYRDDRDRDDYRPRRSFQERRRDDWDNDTGRAYRSSRSSDDRRPYRYGADGSDRRPFGRDEKRRKAPPKPYGYDDFHETKKRDTKDYFWLKDTEIQRNDDNS